MQSSVWGWIGGRIGAVAGSGFLIGLFTVAYGATPGEAWAELLSNLPPWVTSGWFKLICVIIGMGIIWASLRYNVWSRRQIAVNELAEMLSDAIHNLLNRPINNDGDMAQWEVDFKRWCDEVSARIAYYKAYFSRADQLHFDRLGKIPMEPWNIARDEKHRWLLNQLSLKFDRLRDIINWTQQRTR